MGSAERILDGPMADAKLDMYRPITSMGLGAERRLPAIIRFVLCGQLQCTLDLPDDRVVFRLERQHGSGDEAAKPNAAFL